MKPEIVISTERYSRNLLWETLTAGHEVLCREACQTNNKVQIRRLDNMLEEVRKQLFRPWQEDCDVLCGRRPPPRAPNREIWLS